MKYTFDRNTSSADFVVPTRPIRVLKARTEKVRSWKKLVDIWTWKKNQAGALTGEKN